MFYDNQMIVNQFVHQSCEHQGRGEKFQFEITAFHINTTTTNPSPNGKNGKCWPEIYHFRVCYGLFLHRQCIFPYVLKLFEHVYTNDSISKRNSTLRFPYLLGTQIQLKIELYRCVLCVHIVLVCCCCIGHANMIFFWGK